MVYADALRQSVFNPGAAADLIDGLLVGVQFADMYSGGSASSTASASAVIMPNSSIEVTVAADESVLIIWNITYSQSGAGIVVWRTYKDETALNSTAIYLNAGANTGATGYQASAGCSQISTPGAGTFTYSLYWSISANTLYSRFGNINVLKFKKRP